MNYQINNQKLQVKYKAYRRAKRIRIRLRDEQTISVTGPKRVSQQQIKQLLKNNHNWLESQLQQTPPSISPNQITQLRIKTRQLVRDRLAYFNQFYNFEYHRITIRDQISRWGSCSSHKTLSFNLRLALLPTDLSDYVVVHELCHLQEMNHSSKFWDLVAKTIPDHPLRRRKLNNWRLTENHLKMTNEL